ncbi:NADPH-dependent 2,4-dienoyl-CoA reductase/sulfur reductase-like enzyme [Azospirillum lipoferum]|uniref:NAD(P)/FAD-dependent oxidoreductase n=1 Tax=Azospirillum lipoferum TaxID=193 RepID=A0A5A9GL54_AZOLI|nr:MULTISPECIES: FAD/NAD(P)-binding oxidoreductase [Azospirillum]KAA0595151.1 NAD(P)/FAD-dependent oxidoreductase [Azospirillum lipoferum]MCP1611982.1 NADPH-dependent 2,4-dienoyl-CoA reductase/sulfur reductase-like enzyme [Azospirillum lipoferum]MDW5533259.1 FAD/NAD(P)-binding oxidoreductase [Azospirillum sp. NL1]
MTEPNQSRVVIVGAGPAGIRAAETLAAVGLRPTVIDEGARAGGQIYRRPPDGFTRPPSTLYGSQAGKAVALHTAFDGLVSAGRIVHLPRHSVVALADGTLHAVGDGGSRRIGCDRLILATGATDRLAPVLGWQAPGVYSLGAMQIALKAQGVAMGRRIVLAGSGPLLTLLATQLRKAGAEIAAVLDTAGMRGQIAAFPDLAVRPSFALHGLAMRARLGRLYHAGIALEGIEATDTGVTAVRWKDAAGRMRSTACDAVGLGWHLKAETQLADLAGCRFAYDETWAQWLPCADCMGRAGDGVYLAGDGLRLLGADGAEVAGRLAAAACLSDLGLPVPDVAADLKRLDRLERFARGIARAFPWPADQVRTLPDDTVLCRCEGITAGAVRETAVYGGAEANRVKSLGRAGMGRCQGRYCQLAAADLIAATAGLAHAGDAGRLRAQAPVRPVTIAALLEGE